MNRLTDAMENALDDNIPRSQRTVIIDIIREYVEVSSNLQQTPSEHRSFYQDALALFR